ncbi:MAG: hypothetical protein LQ351_002084 [Letrouitia transgressa]|nr:MAG: hypothetical protein LQ351_002084 [Letrouitia transgressa]
MSGKFSASQDNKNVFEDIQRNLRDGDSRKLLEAAGTASQQARQTPDGSKRIRANLSAYAVNSGQGSSAGKTAKK